MTLDLARLTPDYGDAQGEALACRRDCALFDFSFVARARLAGPGACAALARLTARPMRDLGLGRIRYALRANAFGDLLADLTVWRLGDESFEVMSGRREDIAFAAALDTAECSVADLSETTAIFAVQGPGALRALARVMDTGAIARLAYFACCPARIAGRNCRVGRLGYTGEAGFEIILERADTPMLWDLLSRHIRPAGFAAADILRIEAGFLLFANEFRVPVSAQEAGLGRFAEPRGAERRPPVRLVCFRARTGETPLLWRAASEIRRPEHEGAITITSACRSIVARGTLGLGYVLASEARSERAFHDPADRFHEVRIVPLPFYDREKRRPRAAWNAAGAPPSAAPEPGHAPR